MPLFTELGLTALQGGFGLLGNLLGFGSTQATNKANKNLMRYQYDLNLDLWNKNNAYNTPIAQMERLRTAGLNPNLIYGSSANTGVSSSPASSPSAPTMQSYQNFGSLGIGEALDRYMGLETMQSQIDLNSAKTNQYLQQTATEAIRTIREQMAKEKDAFELSKLQERYDVWLELQDSVIKNNLSLAGLNSANEEWTRNYKGDLTKSEIGRNESQSRLNDSGVEVNKENVVTQRTQQALNRATTAKRHAETKFIKQQGYALISRLQMEQQLQPYKVKQLQQSLNIGIKEYQNLIKEGRLIDQKAKLTYWEAELKKWTRKYGVKIDIAKEAIRIVQEQERIGVSAADALIPL